MRLILALVVMLSLGACGSGQESPKAGPTKQPTASPSPPGSGPPAQPDASDTKACAEVRAGIDAFNMADFASTVAHFRLALPLAKAQLRTSGTGAAKDLVEAVTYYAELAPADYPQSAASSTQFAKYKAITLGQCAGEPSQGGSPGPPQVPA